MKLFTLSIWLKIVIVTLLFTVFAWHFAQPSIKKFLFSDTILVKTFGHTAPEDSPSVTFCLSDNITSSGWKSQDQDKKNLNIFITQFEFYCSNATTVPAAMECIDNHSYTLHSLTETIITNELGNYGYLNTDDPLWIEEVSDLFYHGEVLCLKWILLI